MATNQPVVAGDGGYISHVAGMSKNQLYDIMSQMKGLMEQNQQQARQILIENPALTKSLFQAQIILGMVRPPKVMPNIQQTLSQQPQPPVQVMQQTSVPAPHPMPIDTGIHGDSSSSQQNLPTKQQVQPPASLPPLSFQSQTIPSTSIPSSQQVKGTLNTQMPPISLSQSTHVHNLPPPPQPSFQQPPFQPHHPGPSSQIHHSIQSGGLIHQPLQPPLPPHPRPPSMQPFQQLHSQSPHNLTFQPPGTTLQIPSQPMFQHGPPASFPQGQPPLPVQPPPQQMYQGNSQMGMDYSSQNARPMQVERVTPWPTGPSENAMPGPQLSGPPPPQSMTSGQQLPGQGRLPQLTTEMEKALLQQVMSLTPEQINLLPPEQRQQVLQLQQMLR